MRPLKIVLLTPDPERFRGALTLAAAHAALGGEGAIFFQLEAVALLRQPFAAPNDAAHITRGLPPLSELMDDVTELGVRLIACQSGMELSDMEAKDLPSGVTVGGPISFLQAAADEEQLVVI